MNISTKPTIAFNKNVALPICFSGAVLLTTLVYTVQNLLYYSPQVLLGQSLTTTPSYNSLVAECKQATEADYGVYLENAKNRYTSEVAPIMEQARGLIPQFIEEIRNEILTRRVELIERIRSGESTAAIIAELKAPYQERLNALFVPIKQKYKEEIQQNLTLYKQQWQRCEALNFSIDFEEPTINIDLKNCLEDDCPVTTITYGDINSDAQVNQQDVTLLKNVLNPAIDTIQITELAADVNLDGDINHSDLVFLQAHLDGATTPLGTQISLEDFNLRNAVGAYIEEGIELTPEQFYRADLNLDGAVNMIDINLHNSANGDYWPLLPGDITRDGRINESDLEILQKLVRSESIENFVDQNPLINIRAVELAADVNLNGDITKQDLADLVRAIHLEVLPPLELEQTCLAPVCAQPVNNCEYIEDDTITEEGCFAYPCGRAVCS